MMRDIVRPKGLFEHMLSFGHSCFVLSGDELLLRGGNWTSLFVCEEGWGRGVLHPVGGRVQIQF